MVMEARPLAEITTDALRVLYTNMGIVNTVRFVNQYSAGHGDYTEERERLFAATTMDDIVSEVKKNRKRSRAAHKRALSRTTRSNKRV